MLLVCFSNCGVSIMTGDGNRRLDDANYALDVLCRCLVDRDDARKKKIMPVPLKEHGDEPVLVSQVNNMAATFCNVLHMLILP